MISIKILREMIIIGDIGIIMSISIFLKFMIIVSKGTFNIRNSFLHFKILL
jgi:hypothetical protein